MPEKDYFGFLSGKTVCLIGAGVSNMPLAEVLVSAGARVTVRDRAEESQLGERAERIKAIGCRLVTGEKYLDGLNEAYLFRSPGIRPDDPCLASAVAQGSQLTSEMEMFLEKTPARVFAVTGSDGKSTTTTLVSLLLKAETEKRAGSDRRVFLGGNIGEPLLHRLDLMRPEDFVAAELSSFQLMTVHSPVYRAVITNITPNHLNWHTGMEEYIRAKAQILRGCEAAVLNFGNETTRRLGETTEAPVTYFSRDPIPLSELKEKDAAICLHGDRIEYAEAASGRWQTILTLGDIKLPGLHNAENYMAAIGATWGHVSPETIREVAGSFGGVKHRLQLMATIGGVDYYNSSIDTTPTRTLAALSAMKDRTLVLMLGGYDKHLSYEPLAEGIASEGKYRALILFGATAELIARALEQNEAFRRRNIPVVKAGSFDQAFERASETAKEGDAVLLSPACASFDEFPNFEKRGERFGELIERKRSQ